MIMHLLKNMAICTYAVFSGLSMATAVIFNTIWLAIKEFLNRKFVKIPENVFFISKFNFKFGSYSPSMGVCAHRGIFMHSA